MGGRHKNSLRIIGGEHRGRRLQFVAPEGLRPTTDRVRETLFNWLQNRIQGARVLDLFAGSGALGFEAASRGAREVMLVEMNRQVCEVLRQNAALLDSPDVDIRVQQRDARKFLQQSDGSSFDIVFLDPPFRKNLLQPVIELLESDGWLADDALIYIEQGSDEPEAQLPPSWKPLKEKSAGQVRYQLFGRELRESATSDNQ
ncbi:16S rRNA (guanine(966)-N(2))-methyltransferase RsmD [Solemya velum gill symbiont]|uniref:Ribosomal RNA small subunit methyltransferase D n=2 Tax=Solemya velum gill symbiont TaxID=2340 RepID=A0A0B0H6Z8_SOVGS|nr:16S rRNA (guanine(966)-N(2))-methyltransferase RsmD [Solemya velum gill symbiont]KHF24412.1 16S rRNA m(2)G-966 methyltransferase [Solemya velum gill symbiont]